MFMRLVQLRVKAESSADMMALYDTRVIPELQKIKSCLYASLIFSTHNLQECMSLTLWESQSDVEAYERSGLYKRLIEESHPYLEDSSEWKIQLSKNLTLEYQPVPEEPVVKSYVVAPDKDGLLLAPAKISQSYVRIVSAKIQAGKMEEFERIYTQHVLPAVRTMKGCRYASLIEGAKDRNEVISMTLWESKEDADEYERSGWFDALRNRVRHTFSDLYQWKMKLEHDAHRQAGTSEDLTVEGYNIVTGKSFQ
jgi:heme-degrading monooxygenase HmoA